MKWYVLRFMSSRFTPVCSFLTLNKITFFCPMRQNDFRRSDAQFSIRKRLSPVFAGYLFVQMDFEKTHPEKLAAFQHIYGLVTFCGNPVPVPTNIMDTMLKWSWDAGMPILRGKKAIPHEFAEILGLEDPMKRSLALLNYLTDVYSQPHKRLNMEHE